MTIEDEIQKLTAEVKAAAIALAVGLLCVCNGVAAPTPHPLVSALSSVESGDNDHARGRAGEVSRYQILPSVWRQYARPGESPRDAQAATRVLLRIMRDRVGRFHRLTGRWPSDWEWYVLWNAPAQVLDRQRVSPRVAPRADRFRNVVMMKRGTR